MSVQIVLPHLERSVWCLVTISLHVGYDTLLMLPLALLLATLLVMFSKDYSLCELKWQQYLNIRMEGKQFALGFSLSLFHGSHRL